MQCKSKLKHMYLNAIQYCLVIKPQNKEGTAILLLTATFLLNHLVISVN